MSEIEFLHEDEKKLIETSSSFQRFSEAHPEATVEDFILGKIKTSKGFNFAKKFNKDIEPNAYFANLKAIARRQMIEEWNNDPQAPEFMEAQSPKDMLPQESDSSKNLKQEIKSDRKIDFENDETFLALSENIPLLKKSFENSSLDGLDENSEEFKKNLAQRQKIADYLRFSESGKKSREAIKQKNWKFLEREYRFFPKIPTDILFKIYDNHLAKNNDSERTAMLQRVIGYRLENIKNGKQKIADENELKNISDFISAEKSRYPDFAQSMDNILQEITADYNKHKAEKEAEDKRLEEERLAKKENEERLKIKADKQGVEEDEPIIVINQELPTTTISPQKIDNHSVDDDTTKESAASPKTEEIIPDKTENNSPNDEENDDSITVDTLSKSDDKTKENSSASFNWREETKKDWKSYAEKKQKKAEITDASEKLIVKIFANEDKAKVGDSEAAITYRGSNSISLSGRDAEIPDLSIFENLIASSKKVSKKIKFGEIRDADFSAKLMIACLRNPDVEMVNAPKVEDLKDLSPKVKEILKFELENRGKQKSKEVREKLNLKEKSFNNPKPQENRPRKPKRQYTKEETEAYLKRKQMREAQLNSK